MKKMKLKTMIRCAQTSLRPLKPPIVRAPNWGKLSRFRGSFLLTRSNEKLSPLMTLLRIIVRSSVGRGRCCENLTLEVGLDVLLLLQEAAEVALQEVPCGLIVQEKERPTSSLSDIIKKSIQTKSLQMAVITEINVASSSAAGTELLVTRKRTYKKRAKKNARNKGDKPRWGDLLPELLAIIAKRVPIPGFFSFPRVSRTFRAAALSVKSEFLGSKGPLVFMITSRAKRSCFFFDVKARDAYRTKFQMFCGRVCIGISSGFLIQQSLATDLMLTNPMTSQRVDFPQMLPGFYIFAHTMPQRGFLAGAVCTGASSIHFCRSGDNEWSLSVKVCLHEGGIQPFWHRCRKMHARLPQNEIEGTPLGTPFPRPPAVPFPALLFWSSSKSKSKESLSSSISFRTLPASTSTEPNGTSSSSLNPKSTAIT